jgi:hypothetical protein
LQKQCRFADARIAADQKRGPWRKTAAAGSVEFIVAGQ